MRVKKVQTPQQKYQQDIDSGNFSYDPVQEATVKKLQQLFDNLIASTHKPTQSTHWFSKLFAKQNANNTSIQGLYMWGGVGRGKTYLMDTFFEALPIQNKMRMHFHRFMHRVHHELGLLPDTKNPLLIIADKFSKEAKVICFDEFFVSDITDAMILGTLFQALFERGITLVATSNIPPDELYRNGLQRARFLPAIELIKKHTEVLNVDNGVDYRLRTLTRAEIYHSPLDDAAEQNLSTYFTQLSNEPRRFDIDVTIEGRQLAAIREAEGVIQFSFHTLCETARSQRDYMEISRCYHTVLLSSVKQMGANSDDAARRFIALVDEFYERHVKLIISAEVPLEALYAEGRLSFEFKRCRSRLLEMQSHEYLSREHLP